MSDNVGLSTPRGSGTSGHVQRNLANLRFRERPAPYAKDLDAVRQHKQRQPDREILDHERKRAVEVKVFALRSELEDDEVDEEEIDKRCDALREKLLAELASGRSLSMKRSFKQGQTHEMADAKIKESERLRRALKISQNYEEGSHWKRKEEERASREAEAEEKQDGDR